MIEEESWKRNRGGGIMEEESAEKLPGGICEASGKHLEGFWGASESHIWEDSGSWEGQGRPEAVLEEKLSKSFCFTAFSRTSDHFAYILEGRCHDCMEFTAT